MSSYIKLFKCLLILLLIVPAYVNAKEPEPILAYNEIAYQALLANNALQTQLWLPNPDPPKAPVAKARPRTGYGGSCVAFAKRYVGVYGTWGNGGKYLSLNSGPVVGAVMIFTYMHVAVVIGVTDTTVTIIESNYDWHGSIRTRTMLKTNTTIRGYHLF